jgi:hypothetical protein
MAKEKERWVIKRRE